METEADELPETRILEINLISAQDLKKIPTMRRMHTYALAWVDPRTKLRSDLDRVGGQNPTWNDKFLFRVSNNFINADTSAVQFHIYALGYIRDYFVGTVRYILSSTCPTSGGFSALHIRRRSGRVHGVLNIAATVYRSSDFPSLAGISAICVRDLIGKQNNNKTESKRTGQQITSAEEEEVESGSCKLLLCQDEPVNNNSSSSFTTITAFRDGKSVGSKAGNNNNNNNKEVGGNGSLTLCALLLSKTKT